MDIAINYMFLGRAIGHYSRLGYHYIEAPWLVSEQASDITRPPEAPQLSLPLLGGALVASAEQSFLQLDLDNRLPEGRFVACTPCFRPEPVPDRYRQTTFMKVELYQNVDVSEESMFVNYPSLKGGAWKKRCSPHLTNHDAKRLTSRSLTN